MKSRKAGEMSHDQAKQKSFFATGLRRPTKQTYLLNSSKDMTIELGPTTERNQSKFYSMLSLTRFTISEKIKWNTKLS